MDMQPAPDLATLPPAKRQLVEFWLADFEQGWDENRLAARVCRLPAAGDPVRLTALIELVKLDLREQWRRGRMVVLETYLESYPELGVPDTVPAALVLAEYEQRVQAGMTDELLDFARRFPRQTAELQPQLKQFEAAAAGQPQEATVQPRPLTLSQSAHPAGPPTLPERFGRYRILKKLGQGGMGAVYLADDTALERRVALKVPHFAADDGPEVLERFYREARAAAKLHHANLCPLYDVGAIDGIPYLTMAFVEGQTLAERLKAGPPLGQRHAAALVRKLALALHEAHCCNVIHRDLKPANVMLNQRGDPVVMDFGLARRTDGESARLTQTGAVLGTPAYMPPEQVKGALDAMGPGCDIYSLGVILYELLTGRLPFEGPVMVVIAQILARQPEPPSVHCADLDPRLEAICVRAMQKESAARYPSMTELAAALTDYLRGPAAPVSPPVPVVLPGKPATPAVLPQPVNMPAPVRIPVLPPPLPAPEPAPVRKAALPTPVPVPPVTKPVAKRPGPATVRHRTPAPPTFRKGGKPASATRRARSGVGEVIIGLFAIAITTALILSYWLLQTPGPSPHAPPKPPAKTDVRGVK
jgi:serine/threonine protein kinase